MGYVRRLGMGGRCEIGYCRGDVSGMSKRKARIHKDERKKWNKAMTGGAEKVPSAIVIPLCHRMSRP